MERTTNPNPFAIVAIAAVLLLIVGAGGALALSNQDDDSIESTAGVAGATTETVTETTTETVVAVPIPRKVAGPDLGEDPTVTCYVGDVPSTDLVVEIARYDGNFVAATTLQPSNDRLIFGDGTADADGGQLTLTMVDPATRDEATQIWYVGTDVLQMAEDVFARQVDCDEVADEVQRAHQLTGRLPVDPEDATYEFVPALSPGTHCFTNETGHPADQFVELVVNADGTVVATTRTMDADGTTTAMDGQATGYFNTSNEIVIEITRVFHEEGQANSQSEVWTVGDGALFFGLSFTNTKSDCTDLT